jgi:SAM-dependent methyltransferase
MKNIIEKPIVNEEAWFKHWFDSSFYHKLYANRDEKEAAGFIDGLLEALQPADNSEMLDLGCGNGRHSKYLASKRYRVTGLDLASSSIREAKKAETKTLRFYRHDMRVPFGENHFDYVFNFFTSFGYFKTDKEDNLVVSNIANSLKPGGRLVMDYINAAYAEKKLVAAETKDTDGIIYHITRWSDEEYFFKKIVIDDMQNGKPFEYTEQVKKFSLSDLDQMFIRHGLQLQQLYGDYSLNGYNKETSPRLILIAKKN